MWTIRASAVCRIPSGRATSSRRAPRCQLLQIGADSLSEPARGGRLQSESRFRGGGGLGGTVRRRGVEWGRRGGGAHHLEARGRLQRVDRRGRLSGVILSIWRIESEQAKRRVGGQSRRRRAIMSEGYKVRGATPRHPSRSAPRAPARPLPRVAARHGPARLHHFPAMCFAPALPVSECALSVVEQTGFAEST